MKSIRILTITIIIFSFSFTQEFSNDTLLKTLEKAKNYYNNGEYMNVIKELEDALAHYKNGDRVKVLKYLAFSYVSIGDNPTGQELFKKIFSIEPKFELNPSAVPGEIFSIYMRAKKERAREAAMCSCFIPGSGQMMLGKDMKGKVIMVASGITFLSSTILWLTTEQKCKDYLAFGPDDIDKMNQAYDEYNRWYKISLLSSAAFIGISIYSICDALFTDSGNKSAMNNSNKGFYCMPYKEHIQIGYYINF
jgi:tetratricopeptide (TPR) repeat protein